MMADLTLAAIGAANIAVAFIAAVSLYANGFDWISAIAMVACIGAALATATFLETLADPFEQPFGDIANVPETPSHNGRE